MAAVRSAGDKAAGWETEATGSAPVTAPITIPLAASLSARPRLTSKCRPTSSSPTRPSGSVSATAEPDPMRTKRVEMTMPKLPSGGHRRMAGRAQRRNDPRRYRLDQTPPGLQTSADVDRNRNSTASLSAKSRYRPADCNDRRIASSIRAAGSKVSTASPLVLDPPMKPRMLDADP